MGVFTILILALALAAPTTAGSVSPIEKVLQMMEELQEKVIVEGRGEAKTYDKFACFCKDTTDEKVDEIEDGQALVDELVSTINDRKADRVNCDETLEELNNDVAAIEKEMADASAENAKENAIYQVDRKEITDSMGGVMKAKDIMKAGGKGEIPALVQRKQVTKAIRSALRVASNLGIDDPQYHETLASLLQEAPVVETINYEQNADMDGQLGMMDNIENDFDSQLKQKDLAENKRVFAFTSFMQDRTDKKNMKNKNIAKQQALKDKKTGELGRANQDLTEAQATLHDNQAYIKDLTEKCNAKSDEWDQRTNMRKAELAALTSAIDIVGKRVQAASDGAGKGMKRLLLKSDNAGAIKAAAPEDEDAAGEEELAQDDEVSFVQIAQLASPRASLIGAGLLAQRRAAGLTDGPHDTNIVAALSLLKSKGAELKSEMLLRLVSQAQADPFKKIKQLISELIGRLSQEAADEATHKGWCDKELAKAAVMRDDAAGKIEQLNAMLSAHEATHALLTDEITALEKQIDELDTAKELMTKQREDEKAENENTISEATDGKAAIEDAIGVLTSFYGAAKEGGEAPALVQQDPTKAEEMDMQGDYKGNQAAGGGIMAMMDVILSDMVRTIEVTGDEEDQSVREYTELLRSTEISISTKTSGRDAKDSERSDVGSTIQNEMSDLRTEQGVFDKGLQEFIELQPACIDTGMSYEDRVAKREQEIESLNNAMCILDKEGPVKGDMATC